MCLMRPQIGKEMNYSVRSRSLFSASYPCHTGLNSLILICTDEERVKCPWFDYLDELMKAHSYNIERDDWVEGLDHPPPPPAPAPILAAQAPFYYQDNQMQGVDHHDANYNAVAGPAYPVAAPAPPPPPPAAVAPVIAPRARSPSPLIAVCDMCDEVLIDLSNSQREAHLTACFPDANVSLADCIVCGVVLDGMEEVDKETHVDRCLKGEGGVAMKETFRKSSLPYSPLLSIKTHQDDHDDTAFVYPRFGRPADEACTVCFEEFAVHEQLTILSCHCLYHSSCIEEWNSTSAGRFCPVHRD